MTKLKNCLFTLSSDKIEEIQKQLNLNIYDEKINNVEKELKIAEKELEKGINNIDRCMKLYKERKNLILEKNKININNI